MSSILPNGAAGWAGLALIGGTLLYHRALGTVGLVLGFGAGIYLYFVLDDSSS